MKLDGGGGRSSARGRPRATRSPGGPPSASTVTLRLVRPRRTAATAAAQAPVAAGDGDADAALPDAEAQAILAGETHHADVGALGKHRMEFELPPQGGDIDLLRVRHEEGGVGGCPCWLATGSLSGAQRQRHVQRVAFLRQGEIWRQSRRAAPMSTVTRWAPALVCLQEPRHGSRSPRGSCRSPP